MPLQHSTTSPFDYYQIVMIVRSGGDRGVGCFQKKKDSFSHDDDCGGDWEAKKAEQSLADSVQPHEKL